MEWEISVLCRLYRKIDRSAGPDKCWPWKGAVNRHERGFISIGGRSGKVRPIPQVVWELYHDKPFPEKMFACHTCDNPRCANPSHIWVGTRSDNVKDAIAKGRWSDNLAEFNAWKKQRAANRRR